MRLTTFEKDKVHENVIHMTVTRNLKASAAANLIKKAESQPDFIDCVINAEMNR